MSKEHMTEVISSLVDGEGTITKSDIEAIKNDPVVAKKWSNYHLISNVVSETVPPAIPRDFASRVMHAVAQEPVVLAPKSSKISAHSWFRPIAGFAVAATVALVTVGGLQTLWQPPGIGGEQSHVLAGQNTLQSSGDARLSAPVVPASTLLLPVNSNAARVSGLPVTNAYNESGLDSLRWKRTMSMNNHVENDKKMAQELNRLLMNHVRSAGTMQGMLPYARMAGYDDK